MTTRRSTLFKKLHYILGCDHNDRMLVLFDFSVSLQIDIARCDGHPKLSVAQSRYEAGHLVDTDRIFKPITLRTLWTITEL